MKNQPCRGFWADGRKFRELVDQRSHRLRKRARHLHQAGDVHTAGHRRHPLLRSFRRLFDGIVKCHKQNVFQRLDIGWINDIGSEFYFRHALIAGHFNRDLAAGGASRDGCRGQFFLGPCHLGLHFFDLRHQLRLVHDSRIRS